MTAVGHSKLLACTERSHDATHNSYQCPETQASTPACTRITRQTQGIKDTGGMGEGECKGLETKVARRRMISKFVVGGQVESERWSREAVFVGVPLLDQ